MAIPMPHFPYLFRFVKIQQYNSRRDKMQEKKQSHYKVIFDVYYKEFDTKGLKTISTAIRKFKDNFVVYFEIQQWKDNKTKNLFDYTYIIVDENDNVIKDEANGELTIWQVYQRINEVFKYRYVDYTDEYFCVADDLDIDCIECNRCEDW